MREMLTTLKDALAESPVFAQGGCGGESLATVLTLDLLATVSVHTFVTTQVRKLSVSPQTHFALERLDAAVNVLVLLEAAGRGKRLAALGAGVCT